MKNITDYVDEYDKSFAEAGLSVVDSLVFSQLCYLTPDELFAENPTRQITISELSDADNPSVFNVRKSKKFKDFLEKTGRSKRFKDVIVSDYVNLVDVETECQFSATVYRFNDTAYVAFRGTDATLVGWKEDFNYLYNESIPSQVRAAEYLKKLAHTLPKNFYIGGHSKGGLVGAYAAATCGKRIQSRILKIFNHDSPGLRDSLRETEGYKNVESKIESTIPQGSLFGLINNCADESKIVKSSGLLFQQHEPFTWYVDDGDLVYMEDITDTSRRISHSLNTWLCETDDKGKQLFFETVYGVAAATNEHTVRAIGTNLFKNLPLIVRSVAEVDKETSARFIQMINQFIRLLFEYEKLKKLPPEKPEKN